MVGVAGRLQETLKRCLWSCGWEIGQGSARLGCLSGWVRPGTLVRRLVCVDVGAALVSWVKELKILVAVLVTVAELEGLGLERWRWAIEKLQEDSDSESG